jgi:hypothetical protein
MEFNKVFHHRMVSISVDFSQGKIKLNLTNKWTFLMNIDSSDKFYHSQQGLARVRI